MNPSLGPDSPTSFYVGKLVQEERNFNVDFSYPIEIGFASPLNIAFGAEHRWEAYQIREGETGSWIAGEYDVQEVYDATTDTVSVVTHGVGSNGLPGFGPDSAADESRSSYAAYLDLETDITSAFTLGVAGRYEHFSDFGSSWNGKVAGRYAFSPAVAIRGAASTGFKAPTPGQLFTRNVSTSFQPGTGEPYELAMLRATDPAAQFYGATPLKPEKSKNLSVGVVFTPSSRLTLTVDYYNIKVTDRIGVTGQIPVLESDRPILQERGVPNWATLGRVRFMTNGFATRTNGVDVVLTHTLPTDLGTFSTSLSGNYTATKITRRDSTITEDGREFPLLDAVATGNIEDLYPKVRGSITETWNLDRLTVVGRARYYGDFTHYSTAGSKNFGAELFFDLSVSYALTDNFTLAVGGDNILDNYPDKETRGIYPLTNSDANGAIYLRDSTVDYNGTFLYARVSAKF